VKPDRATWQAAHRAFTQTFVAPPDTIQQKTLAKLSKQPLPKEVADTLLMYEGRAHESQCMTGMTLDHCK
jgi:hypothetical protein